MKKPTGMVGFGVLAVVLGAWIMWKLPGFGREQLIAADELSAIDALRRVHAAELDFRRNDGDGNAVPDFWAADVSGLFRAAQPNGEPCAILDPSIAAADRAALPPSDGPRPRLTAAQPPTAWHGYWLRAVKGLAADGPDDDTQAWESLRGFGFVAYPAEPGVTGRRVFLVGEDGVVWAKGVEAAGREGPAEWPARGPEADGWKRVP